MNTRIIQIRALDKKLLKIKPFLPVIAKNQSWIRTIRESLGMTVKQLASRLGITQGRVSIMEQNEKNMKISTLEKVAAAMDCQFVPLFIPNKTLEQTVRNQAEKKAKEILANVNQNMALENQLSTEEEILQDMIEDYIHRNTKQIWS